MAFLALGRGMDLRFQGRNSYDQRTLGIQRGNDVGQITILIRRGNVFKNIKAVDPIKAAISGRREYIVKFDFHRPGGIGAFMDIRDEHRIEIDDRKMLNVLLDDTRSKGIAAADLEDSLASAEHLSHKPVTRKRNGQTRRIVLPDLIVYDAEVGLPPLALEVDKRLILRFSCLC